MRFSRVKIIESGDGVEKSNRLTLSWTARSLIRHCAWNLIFREQNCRHKTLPSGETLFLVKCNFPSPLFNFTKVLIFASRSVSKTFNFSSSSNPTAFNSLVKTVTEGSPVNFNSETPSLTVSISPLGSDFEAARSSSNLSLKLLFGLENLPPNFGIWNLDVVGFEEPWRWLAVRSERLLKVEEGFFVAFWRWCFVSSDKLLNDGFCSFGNSEGFESFRSFLNDNGFAVLDSEKPYLTRWTGTWNKKKKYINYNTVFWRIWKKFHEENRVPVDVADCSEDVLDSSKKEEQVF